MATTYRVFHRISDNRLLQPVMGSDGAFGVPLAAHIRNVADAYGEQPANISGTEVSVLPDLSGALPCPVTPLSPEDQERADAQALTLPTFAQIDTIVSNINSLADVKVFLARLAKVVRVIARNR